ncbi:pyocin S6 family toxin immunity protein [Pseudomonas sp. KU26590]|uniref:pyocin S6 family toxin immunity protein n=1 Tax=Pseudomonas sp. KU26590 TaxID=2991051 RepID=UPI00223E5051|nr:pyocin S6 family toxin immunity protein [Pseudomonas sp. KU26590]UZJ62002.1 pyocin S6 family toxin immunity protein [Pseudomonas sp. KU26590]
MFLYIFGFLLDSTEDDSLKFEMKIDPSLDDEIVARLGHASLNAMAEGDWPLTNEQVTMLSSLTGRQLPTDLKLLIGVVA